MGKAPFGHDFGAQEDERAIHLGEP